MIPVFIGFILIFFQIPVGKFMLDPAFLGYFLIFLGLRSRRQLSSHFTAGAIASLGMAVISLIPLAVPVFHWHLPFAVSNLLTDLILMARIFLLLQIILGTQEVEQNQDVDYGSRRLKTAWLIQALCQLLCAILIWLPAATVGGVLSVISTVLTVTVIITVYFLYSLVRM